MNLAGAAGETGNCLRQQAHDRGEPLSIEWLDVRERGRTSPAIRRPSRSSKIDPMPVVRTLDLTA